MDEIKDNEGWNIVDLTLPLFGKLMIAFKDDTIRIRKGDAVAVLTPMEVTFDRAKDKKINLMKQIDAKQEL